jgi:hypothetical protein
MGRAGSTHGEKRMLAGKPEGMRPLQRLRLRWEDNIKTDLREIVWTEFMLLIIGTSRRALVNTVINLRVA